MLYVIDRANHPELAFRGGQEPIVHLESDLRQTVTWADQNDRRWAFTLSNAGSGYFDDRCDLAQLGAMDWQAIQAHQWSGSGVSQSVKEGKQAELLVEYSFPWELVSRIGVSSRATYNRVKAALQATTHEPAVQIMRDWYY